MQKTNTVREKFGASITMPATTKSVKKETPAPKKD
jgi:hypothetical protein